MATTKRSEHESGWDYIVEENLREMKQDSMFTYSQIADRMARFTNEGWSVSRTQDLFGAHQRREYKWREIVALADVFEVGILDIVVPNEERRNRVMFQMVADRLEFPAELLTRSSRDRARRKQREAALVEEAILYHPEYPVLASAKSAMADLNEELNTPNSRRLDQIKADFAQHVLEYERAADDIRTSIRTGGLPDPTKSPTFQMLLTAWTDRIQARDLSPEAGALYDEEHPPHVVWGVVWAEAAAAHAVEGSDVD